MSQYDLMLDLKIEVGHCDQYFIVCFPKAVTLAGGIREPLLTCSSYLSFILSSIFDSIHHLTTLPERHLVFFVVPHK